jgi:hypothetical protein
MQFSWRLVIRDRAGWPDWSMGKRAVRLGVAHLDPLQAVKIRPQKCTNDYRTLYFHFWTTTPPRLNSDILPNTCVLSVNSFEGKVVMSAYSRAWLAGLARATKL